MYETLPLSAAKSRRRERKNRSSRRKSHTLERVPSPWCLGHVKVHRYVSTAGLVFLQHDITVLAGYSNQFGVKGLKFLYHINTLFFAEMGSLMHFASRKKESLPFVLRNLHFCTKFTEMGPLMHFASRKRESLPFVLRNLTFLQEIYFI